MEPAVLDAIASPRRREILRLVWNDEQSAGAIHRAMPDVTFGAISLQLRSLVKAGLVEALGEVLEVRDPERIVFTYGFASGKPMPPGSSRVTIRLEPDEAGTRLHLRHEFAEAAPRDEHVQGWRFQLSLFGNAVANETYANAQGTVDAWFGAWVIADEKAREEVLTRIVTPRIRFRDRFSLLDGVADLTAHISASQRFMPGIGLQRKGDVRHCQGTVLADWVAAGSDGQERVTRTSVPALGPATRNNSVQGFTNPSVG